jgi:phosphoribosylamine--glycine ligase
MKILIVGSGAREHALAWKLATEPDTDVICAPANDGIKTEVRSAQLDPVNPQAVLALIEAEAIDLTVIGPEAPLAAGVADHLLAKGRRVFGPTRQAARLETSKAFAKDFMHRHGVPTARYRVCASAEEAHAVVRSGELGDRIVVKADGLAAGKGVIVAENRAAADEAIDAAMVSRSFGDAGARVVLEECLSGPEVSFFVLTDGRRALPLPSAQDHKRALDGDAGPNTGGMGAFSPSPLVDRPLHARIVREIVEPVLDGMASEGAPFCGFLYCGLMLTADGPKVIEFNVRLGDPEAQVVLPRIEQPIAPLLWAASVGELTAGELDVNDEARVGVVLASKGYPSNVETGHVIRGLDEVTRECPDTLVFHAGTRAVGEDFVTAGGRVLTIVGRGSTFEAAIARAYDAVAHVRFDGMHYRRDIGRTALGRV